MNAGICCATPTLKFRWDLGVGPAGEAALCVSDVKCESCGKRYKFVDDEGELQGQAVLDLYLEDLKHGKR